jgi:hypothetical protein
MRYICFQPAGQRPAQNGSLPNAWQWYEGCAIEVAAIDAYASAAIAEATQILVIAAVTGVLLWLIGQVLCGLLGVFRRQFRASNGAVAGKEYSAFSVLVVREKTGRTIVIRDLTIRFTLNGSWPSRSSPIHAVWNSH